MPLIIPGANVLGGLGLAREIIQQMPDKIPGFLKIISDYAQPEEALQGFLDEVEIAPDRIFERKSIRGCLVDDWISPEYLFHDAMRLRSEAMLVPETDGYQINRVCNFFDAIITKMQERPFFVSQVDDPSGQTENLIHTLESDDPLQAYCDINSGTPRINLLGTQKDSPVLFVLDFDDNSNLQKVYVRKGSDLVDLNLEPDRLGHIGSKVEDILLTAPEPALVYKPLES